MLGDHVALHGRVRLDERDRVRLAVHLVLEAAADAEGHRIGKICTVRHELHPTFRKQKSPSLIRG